MNIRLISRDYDLKKVFENTGYFENVTISESLDNAEEFDIIIISDQILNINDFVIKEYKQFKSRKVYFMLSNQSSRTTLDNITSICMVNGINVIPPKLTQQQIVDRIISDLFPNNIINSNVISLFGADSSVGTTMVATTLAETLANNTNAKVFLMFLSGQRGTSFIKDDAPELGIDNIKDKLINQILTKDELEGSCIKRNNLYILPGADNILDIRHYHPEHIEYLINLASQITNMIIVDCGNAANIDFSGCFSITGLNAGKYRYLITTQLPNNYETFRRTNEQILKLLDIKSEEFLLIANKYYKSPGIPTADELCKKYGINLAGILPYLDFKGWECEFEKSTLLSNTEYKYEVENIAKLIAVQLKIRYIEKKVKKSIFKDIFKK